jgi:hypothetical protein
MPLGKLLVVVAVVGVLAAFGVFLLFPDSRPPIVKNWIRKSQGLGPAQTPTQALDRFKEAVKKRDYETAATFCGADFAEQLRKGAKGAEKLGKAVDDLLHNIEQKGINSSEGKALLRHLEPFPTDFRYDLKQGKEGDTATYAVVVFEPVPGLEKRINTDGRIFNSLVPDSNDPVELKLEGEKDKAWKIHFPVTPGLREKVDYLKDNAGNFTLALENVKYGVKHEASTKVDFENQLRSELEKAK